MKERMSDDELLRTFSEMKAYFHQKKLNQFTKFLNQVMHDNVVMYNELHRGENNEEGSSEERNESSSNGDDSGSVGR